MLKYIKVTKKDTGFITHDDQEKDGLSFKVHNDVVIIEGTEKKINEWTSRNKGQELESTPANAMIESYRKTGVANQIDELEAQIVELKKQL